MATGTGPLTLQDILNLVWNPAGTGPSPTGDSLSFYLMPGSGQNTPILGSGTVQGLGPNPLFVVQPAFRQFVLDSAALGTASATGTATTGLGGYKHASVYVRMSSMTGTVSTLNFYIESRLDGTNWVNLASFDTLASATGATAEQHMHLTKVRGTGVAADPDADNIALAGTIAPGTSRNIPWADDLRIRRDVSGGTTAPIFTYTVTVNAVS